jgi:hypothetical protein
MRWVTNLEAASCFEPDRRIWRYADRAGKAGRIAHVSWTGQTMK